MTQQAPGKQAPGTGRPGQGQPGQGPDGVKQLARRSSASLVGSGITAVAQLALTVAVARGLTREDAGLFFSASSLFLIVSTLVKLGTATGLVWALSGQRARGELDRIHATLRTALLPVLVVGAVAAVLMLVLAGRITGWLLPGGAGTPAFATLESVLRIMAVFVPVAALYDAVTAASRGAGVMRPTLLVERLGRPVAQCLAVVAAAWYGSVLAVTWGWVLPYGFALLLMVRMTREVLRRVTGSSTGRVTPVAGAPAAEPVRVGRWFWAFTAPRAVANLGQIVLQRLDIVLVAAIRGPREAAIYAAATRFLVLGQAAGLAISLAVQPNLGEAIGGGDIPAARYIYRTATTWLLVVTWPIYLFSIVAPQLILSVFGRGYTDGAPVIRLLAASMLVATGCGMVDMVLNMAGRSWWNLFNVALAVTVFVTLELLLIPAHGIVGAALGWSAAILTNNLVPLAQVGLKLKLHPFGRSTSTAAAWALVATGLLPFLALHWGSPGNLVIIAVLVASSLVYAAGLWPLRAVLALDQMPVPGRLRRLLAR